MAIGQAYADTLTSHEQLALQGGCDVLIDSIFNELENIKEPEDIIDTTLGGHLPKRYLYKYTPRFLRKFAVCIITVAWKLAQPQHMRLSSLAEELAAWAIVNEAKVYMEVVENDSEEKGDLDTFIDVYFEDTDFLYLFDDAHDGIDKEEVAQAIGMTSLAFDEWFLPFSDEQDRVAHPYVL